MLCVQLHPEYYFPNGDLSFTTKDGWSFRIYKSDLDKGNPQFPSLLKPEEFLSRLTSLDLTTVVQLCDFVYLKYLHQEFSVEKWEQIFQTSRYLSLPSIRDATIEEYCKKAAPIQVLSIQNQYPDIISFHWTYRSIIKLSQREIPHPPLNILQAKRIGIKNLYMVSRARFICRKKPKPKSRPDYSTLVCRIHGEYLVKKRLAQICGTAKPFLVASGYIFGFFFLWPIMIPAVLGNLMFGFEVDTKLLKLASNPKDEYDARYIIPTVSEPSNYKGKYITSNYGGRIFLQVEDGTIFSVSQNCLLADSQLFKDMWAFPSSTDSDVGEGLSPQNPIKIPRFSKREFSDFVTYMHNQWDIDEDKNDVPGSPYAFLSNPERKVQFFLAVLQISEWALMDNLFSKASEQVKTIKFSDPMEKFKIRLDYNFPYQWVYDVLLQMVERKSLPTLHEVEMMGPECTLLIVNAKERLNVRLFVSPESAAECLRPEIGAANQLEAAARYLGAPYIQY